MPLALRLLVLSSIIIAGKAQTPVAVIAPLSYTARPGSIGTFHCATTENHLISWYVNGTRSTYSVIRDRQISTGPKTPINATWSMSTLTVYASQENDGLSIYCVAVVIGGRDGFSPTATFHVKRQPLPPMNIILEVSEDHRNLTLRWNLPPGLSVSSASHNITYTVYVNITHAGTEFYFNTTMREYTLENPCSDVQFKVTAWDDIGEGSGTTLLYKHYSNDTNQGVLVTKTTTASVTFDTSGEPSVQLTFQIYGACFDQRIQDNPQLFLVETWSDCSDSRHHQGPLTLESTIVNSTVTLVIPHLLPKCHITARIQNQEVFNTFSNITFATYGVQKAEVTKDRLLKSICITCTFARRTSAQGCYTTLFKDHDSMATNTTGLRIEREGDSLNATGCFENLERGLYHVVVYDIEEDGTIDWQNRALFIAAALNWTSPDQLNTNTPSMLTPSSIFTPQKDTPSILTPSSNFTLQKDNTVLAIAGGAGGGALLLMVIIGILSCVIVMRKVRHAATKSQSDVDSIEMKKNEIYGQLPQQQIVRNPAYNWWYPRH